MRHFVLALAFGILCCCIAVMRCVTRCRWAVAFGILCCGALPAVALKAAAGKVDITPDKPAFLAGYGINRLSTGVHDRLNARCLVLKEGGATVALVSVDVIGLPRYQVERIRAQIRRVPAADVIIAATHTHSGPDTLGQWGPSFTQSGVDEVWMRSLRDKVALLVDATASRLAPARIRFAEKEMGPGLSKNIRAPGILDTRLSLMQAVTIEGAPIATLVNFACHPEILNNRNITADFPHWIYEAVDGAAGGVCLYFNGAQGGMITADYDESTAPPGENWAAAERIGGALGRAALDALEDAPLLDRAPISLSRNVFPTPLENERFRGLVVLKIYPKDLAPNGLITTEVNRITVGPAEFLTIPGEALPNIGIYLKSKMTGTPRFLLGLCCDELGYILTPEDYAVPLYRYEASVSVGPQIEPRMTAALRALCAPLSGRVK